MYDHYIAVDWAQKNMAIARMTKTAKTVSVIDVPTDLKEFKLYLTNLKGTKILTIEETTTSQWLYTELKSRVDELLICDPYRNRLLSEGSKTDKIDATKLVQLLRAGLLKPVFHSGEAFMGLRKIVGGYEDLVKSGVRLKNQRSALYRAEGKDKNDDTTKLTHSVELFVLKGLDEGIENYENEKDRYEVEFSKLAKKHLSIRNLITIPGIGIISAVKIVATVVDAKRFNSKGHFLSYCGLVKHEQWSGGRSYGRKNIRYNRTLKGVFKSCALAAIGENKNNPIRSYFEYLSNEKKYADHIARNSCARWIATLALAVLKSGKKYTPKRKWTCKNYES